MAMVVGEEVLEVMKVGVCVGGRGGMKYEIRREDINIRRKYE